MANTYVNKVVIGNQTQIDLTSTTAVESDVAQGKVFFKANGEQATGTASGASSAVIIDTTDPGGGTIRNITVDEVVHLGSKTITSNGTYDPSDDSLTGYSSVTANVQPSLQSKTNVAPTTSSQTITADNGYYGLSSVQINAMPSGTAGTPTATKGTVSNHSVSVTPSVTNTTGYITGGTKTGTAVTVSASELVSGNKSITANGNNIDVAEYSTVSVNVPSSGGMNVQGYHGMAYIRTTTYGKTDVTLTVAKTGTYKVSWMGFRNTTSGTSGSQLYINDTAYGSATTAFTSSYGQSVVLTGVSLKVDDVLVVRARARSAQYYMYVGNLIIEQTA